MLKVSRIDRDEKEPALGRKVVATMCAITQASKETSLSPRIEGQRPEGLEERALLASSNEMSNSEGHKYLMDLEKPE